MNWNVFITVSGVKLLQNNQSIQNFCLWSCKATALSLMWHNFFCFTWKKSSDYVENADVSTLCRSAPPHPDRCPVMVSSSNKIPWNPATTQHPKYTWKHSFWPQTASTSHTTCSRKKIWESCISIESHVKGHFSLFPLHPEYSLLLMFQMHEQCMSTTITEWWPGWAN